MSATKEPLVIEITDEAYKQNSVYRPWDDTKTGAMAANPGTTLTQQPALRMLASASWSLTAAGQ